MPLKLHNTLTKKTEEFSPLHPNKVTLYTCGPTVYNYLQIGNWFAYVMWDVLVRILTANNYQVERVMNITDVGHLTSDEDEGEDKLAKGARREGKNAWDIAEFYSQDFLKGMEALGMIQPQHIVRATDFIPQQLDLVRTLKQKGYTYQTSDGIYFDTAKFPTYPDFAGLDLAAQKAGARVEYNPEKHNPSDFALWKFTPKGEKRDMEWETPADLLENDPGQAKPTSRPAVPVSQQPLQPEPQATSGPELRPGAKPLLGNTVLQDAQDRTIVKPFVSGGGREGEQEQHSTVATLLDTNTEPLVGNSREDNHSTKSQSDQNHEKPVMGFPGWHLECSAMAMNLLGNTIDIHTGGIDHIPVHHTNEIAQSEAATSQQFARFWLHNNHLKSEGKKISKSLGNGYTLQDLAQRDFTPLDLRMFILQSQYSNESNFTWENLEAAKNRLYHWRNIAALRHQTHDTLKSNDDEARNEKTVYLYSASQAILEALNDDLNLPAALAVVDDAFSQLDGKALSDINKHSLVRLLETIDELLGLQLIESTPDISDQAKQLILERERARENKDWTRSDELRDQLASQNVALRDTSHGTVWEYDN